MSADVCVCWSVIYLYLSLWFVLVILRSRVCGCWCSREIDRVESEFCLSILVRAQYICLWVSESVSWLCVYYCSALPDGIPKLVYVCVCTGRRATKLMLARVCMRHDIFVWVWILIWTFCTNFWYLKDFYISGSYMYEEGTLQYKVGWISECVENAECEKIVWVGWK
jgi:hypothetical protein